MTMPNRKNYGIEAGLAMLAVILSITWFYDLGINVSSWSPVNRAFWLGMLVYLTGTAVMFGSWAEKENT